MYYANQLVLSNDTNGMFMASQCAQGHQGNLCGRCTPGYGQTLVAAFGRCRPCASAGAIIALYLLAVLATLLFISLLCNLKAGQRVRAFVVDGPPAEHVPSTLQPCQDSAEMVDAPKHPIEPARNGSTSKTKTEAVVQCTASSGSSVQGYAAEGGSELASDLLKCFVIYLQVCCLASHVILPVCSLILQDSCNG